MLVTDGPVEPDRVDVLLREDTVHLPVTWGERTVAVGPLVVPGQTSCLRCQHLHRTDRDPEWPRLVAQLCARDRAAPVEESTLAATAAALAVGQVLAHLDGAAPATADAAYEVCLPDGDVALRPWPPHPRCGCRWEAARAIGAAPATMAR